MSLRTDHHQTPAAPRWASAVHTSNDTGSVIADPDVTHRDATDRDATDRDAAGPDSARAAASGDRAGNVAVWRERLMAPGFVVIWSSAFIAGVVGVGAAPPLLLILSRFAVAGVLMAAFAAVTHAPWPRGRDLLHVGVAGLLVQGVQFGAFYTAMAHGLPAAVLALVQGLYPVVVALLAAPVLGEQVRGRQWIGFGLGAVGVLLAVADRVAVSGLGIALSVVGLLGISLGTVYQKRFVPRMDPRSGTALQMLISLPLIGGLTVATESVHVSHWGPFAGAVGYMVVVNSFGAFLLFNTMLRRFPASRVSTLFFLIPAVTAVMAWLVVGQAISWATLAGLAVSGVGVLLAQPR